VDTFLLSCRALGRGVEDRMIGDLKRWALERGAARVVIPVVPTARNRPALEFLARLCEISLDAKNPFECVLSASGSSSEWRPAAVAEPWSQPVSGSAVTQKVVTDEADTLVHIATHIQSAAAVLSAARNRRMKRRPVRSDPFVAPCGATEDTLARIWSECLGIEAIGAKDNFFDFGGNSLVATRVLARIRSEFGVEMTLTNVFEKPTIEEMASQISSMLSGGSNTNAVPIFGKR
jgi:hypothetical protein